MKPTEYKQGDRIFANGYAGAFVCYYSEGMVEVRLPGGVGCIPIGDCQPIDPRPGNYYVSVIDGKRTALLLGPFPKHEQALEQVDAVRRKAEELNPRAIWYAFGTARLPDDDSVPIRAGKLNAEFNLPTRAAA